MTVRLNRHAGDREPPNLTVIAKSGIPQRLPAADHPGLIRIEWHSGIHAARCGCCWPASAAQGPGGRAAGVSGGGGMTSQQRPAQPPEQADADAHIPGYVRIIARESAAEAAAERMNGPCRRRYSQLNGNPCSG